MLRALSVLLAPLVCGALACGGADTRPPPPLAAPAAADDDSLDLDPGVDPDTACVGVEVAAEPLPVDLFAVVDRSGSMSEATLTGVSKWYATKMAFHDFLEHAPSGMGFGLSLFPAPGASATSCATDYYSAQALLIGDVQQMVGGALARLDAAPPQGQTPTAPALTSALELATTYALEHVERSVIVVLATDGLPTACAPTDAAALAQLAKAALEGPAHVRTLVVAARSLHETDAAAATGFERIAAAGGTGYPLVIDPRADFAHQLTNALSAAAAREIACDLALPEPPVGAYLDYDAINVVLDGANGRSKLPRVAGPASCTAAGGWYYDVDPARGAPARLNMCKSSCERRGRPTGASGTDGASATGADGDRDRDRGATALRVELGCKSLVR